MRIHPIPDTCPKSEPSWLDVRTCERLPLGGTVLFNIFNTDQPLRMGEIRNFFEHGLCFETFEPVRPGTSLYLRILQVPHISLHRNLSGCCRSISLAEVKWCRVIGDADPSSFCIGVKFYE